MKKLLLLLMLIHLCFGFDLDDLKNQIQISSLEGSFKQEKILEGFKQPIISYGKFYIYTNELIWDMQKPIKSTIKINPDGIFLKQKEKWVKSEGFYDKKLFLQIIQMDIKGLEKNFEIALKGDSKIWSLNLMPKGILKKIFSKIQINGAKYVKTIVLIENNGDKTINNFYDISEKK